jgi:hypothetical protein
MFGMALAGSKGWRATNCTTPEKWISEVYRPSPHPATEISGAIHSRPGDRTRRRARVRKRVPARIRWMYTPVHQQQNASQFEQ